MAVGSAPGPRGVHAEQYPVPLTCYDRQLHPSAKVGTRVVVGRVPGEEHGLAACRVGQHRGRWGNQAGWRVQAGSGEDRL